jgi:CarD family transcriptional regulator
MRQKMSKKKKDVFNIGEIVVYPKHGVGEIKSISTLEISKVKTKYYIIQMEQDKLLIKVPLEKQKEVGLRKIASKKKIEEVFDILRQKQKVRRIMWSRRAQEYDAKIHSGDPVKIGEVIRDLYRKNNQPEQSYSERQMFQIALERLAREVAAIDKTDYFNTTEKIENILNRK